MDDVTLQAAEETAEAVLAALHTDFMKLKLWVRQRNVMLNNAKKQAHWPTAVACKALGQTYPEYPWAVEVKAKDLGICRRCGGESNTVADRARRVRTS